MRHRKRPCDGKEGQMADDKLSRWIGQCGVCLNWFKHPKRTEDNPSPHGSFCPVCRENRLMAPGVVHFVKDAEPEWTDAEHNEIMRLHISDGLTISGAKWRVYQQRGDQP